MSNSAPQFIAACKFASMAGESPATFYRRLSAGFYPQPIRFGARAVRWNLRTVNEYLAASEQAGYLLKRDEWWKYSANISTPTSSMRQLMMKWCWI